MFHEIVLGLDYDPLTTHNTTQDDFHTSCYTKMEYNRLFFSGILIKDLQNLNIYKAAY